MRLRCLMVVALCLAGLLPGWIRAADAEKAATEPIVAEASFASISALVSQLKELGVPVPPTLSAEGIDGTFPFLGGVDDKRPCSITFLARPDIPQSNRAFFSFPSKDPASYLAKLKEQGAKTAVEGQDVFPLGPIFIKFTKDRVIFGGTETALKFADDVALAKQYADGKTIAATWGDIKDIRKNHPEIIKAFIDDMRKKDVDKPAETDGEKFGREMVYNYFEKVLDRLELSVLKSTADSLAVRMLIAPPPPWNGADAPVAMPVLPADCAGRVDLVCTAPNRDIWDSGIKWVIDSGVSPPKSSKVPEADIRGFIADYLAAHFSGEANSLGWTVKDDACVAYVVRQNSKEEDIEAILKKLAADATKLSAVDGEKEHLKVETYTTAAGAKVVRETLFDKEKPFAYIDFLSKGKRVYMTISDSDKKFVETMPLDQDVPNQQLKKGAYIQIDVAKTIDAVNKKQKTPLPLPPALAASLAKATTPITFKAEPAADGLRCELALPVAIIKEVTALLPTDDGK